MERDGPSERHSGPQELKRCEKRDILASRCITQDLRCNIPVCTSTADELGALSYDLWLGHGSHLNRDISPMTFRSSIAYASAKGTFYTHNGNKHQITGKIPHNLSSIRNRVCCRIRYRKLLGRSFSKLCSSGGYVLQVHENLDRQALVCETRKKPV